MNPCTISHLSHVVKIRKKGDKGGKAITLGAGEGGGKCAWTHGIDCFATSSISFWFFICRKPTGIFGMSLRSTTLVFCFWWVQPIGWPIKLGEKLFLKNQHLNQKFGKAFLLFQFWSVRNHLDDVGWFCVDDVLRCVEQHLGFSICESIHVL